MEAAVKKSEADIVALARDGDPEAFEGLVRIHEGRVRSFFAVHLRDPAQADDLSQETFVLAYRRLSAFDPTLPFYPWLKGIALNVLRNDRRKRRPETLQEGWVEALQETSSEPLQDREALEALRLCAQKLDPSAAQLVHARYREGLPLADLAARVGRNAHSISMALVRIRELLRDCVTRSMEGAE
jgi:RNA polymerase sigma-70 factor (ECF subfamily)